MLRDVFYYGLKPNVHPREKFAASLEDARNQCTTEHFWIINEYCDYRYFNWDFDFDFLPDEDVWAEEHNNVWPSTHQKDSGTWLCSSENSDIIIYRADVEPIRHKNVKNDNWVIIEPIEETMFDFGWHPDPTDPAYIYVWGNQWHSGKIMPTVEYHVTGATERKYIENSLATLINQPEKFKIYEDIESFDFSWVPNPTSPPYIYAWGNQWNFPQDKVSVEYIVEGATEYKFINNNTIRKPCMDNWIVPEGIDITSFDFSWEPNPNEPPFIYEFATQWQKTGGPRYVVPGATEFKYSDIQKVKMLSNKDKFNIVDNLTIADFDYSWHPDATEEPFIYVFGNNQYPAEIMPTIEYCVEGATQIKYVNEIVATLGTNKTNWEINQQIDEQKFDFSWVPNPKEPPYIYVWGNKHIEAILRPTIEYKVTNATEYKYMEELIDVVPEWDKWNMPVNIDSTGFDFTWRPDPREPDLIYEFATQWQKTGGPRYVMDGATEVKYIDVQKVISLPDTNKFKTIADCKVKDFDYSWHPDYTEPPYIYHFGNDKFTAEIMPTVEYVVEGATEVKYINDVIAVLDKNMTNWVIPDNVDVSAFDFTWIPNPKDPEYIYEFGTQWQKTGGPQYVVPGASEVKYVDTHRVKISPNKNNFNILNNLEIADFDYSWHPDATEEPYIYVFGNSQYPAEIMPTIEYVVEGATEIKYINDIVAKLSPNRTNWTIPENVDVSTFDFSWIPNPKDPEYIYEFATQWQKTGGPKYIVPGATEIKYVDTQKAIAKASPDKNYWEVLHNLKIKDFDYSWHPDATEEPFIYVFGNTQYPGEIMDTIEYRMPGATEVKYISEVVARLDVDMNGWTVPDRIDIGGFDFSWKPNPRDPDFIYQFGTQWQKTGGPRYIVEGASEVKYIDTQKARRLPNKSSFNILDDIVIEEFDYSWHHDDTDEPYIYVFGNTQYPVEIMPTIEYIPDDAVRLASGKAIGQIKYVTDIIAVLGDNKTHWVIPDNVDVSNFDFSWVPNPKDPAYTYQFGTVLDREDGPRYIHPDLMSDIIVYLTRIEKPTKTPNLQDIVVSKYEIETTLEDLVKQHPNEIFWAMHKNIDYDTFNFDWRPEIVNIQWENEYVYVFGSPDSEITQTYFINASMYLKGNKDFKFIQTEELTEQYLAGLFKKSDMFFVDRSNNESAARFEKLKQKFPTIQKTRYLNSWVDTINRCINRSTTELCWILNSELDYTDFDFEYYPNPWQMKMIQVFGTQWSNWGTTFMVNRDTFAQDTKYIKIIEHLSNLNFVKNRKAKATNVLYDIVYIDHGNMDMSKIKQEGKIVIPYQDSYITTLQKMLSVLPVKKEHYVWVTSTICDYSTFDFTYICDPFAKEQLHVFPSDRQKFGDTFLVDVNKFRSLIEDMNILEDYVKINYNQSQRVKRLPAPVIVTEEDTHVSSINTEFKFPYAVFTTKDNQDINVIDTEPMSLWTPETKNIQITSVGGTRIVVPKEVKDYVKRELYDYPYVITNNKLAKSNTMDIVFLSNGETGAEENYEHLLKVTHGLPNRVTRVDGVNGRVAAYHAAAEASNTMWLFTVFAKLKVSNKFDWNWQPDRMQLPKHYVFHAANPVNGLKYGHMAMIAYNKKLTLANQGTGLDFTMDDEHEVVELNSGIANFNTDEWSTWRTAFREALKLRAENSEISKNRLEMWLTVGMGKFNEYSTEGSQHAVEYFEEVNGDFDKLKLSYDWPWLRAMFDRKYKQ